MTTISASGWWLGPRLGHDPHDDIAVGDNAADPIVFDDDYITNIRVRMARDASCTDAVPGSATGLGVISSRICCAIRYSFGEGKGLGLQDVGQRCSVCTMLCKAVPASGGTGSSPHPS